MRYVIRFEAYEELTPEDTDAILDFISQYGDYVDLEEESEE